LHFALQGLLVYQRYIIVSSQYMNFPNRFLIKGPLRSSARSQNFTKSETGENGREFAGRQFESFSTGFETFICEFCNLCNLRVSCRRVQVDKAKEPCYYRVLGG
jgi:hypothetical protein